MTGRYSLLEKSFSCLGQLNRGAMHASVRELIRFRRTLNKNSVEESLQWTY